MPKDHTSDYKQNEYELTLPQPLRYLGPCVEPLDRPRLLFSCHLRQTSYKCLKYQFPSHLDGKLVHHGGFRGRPFDGKLGTLLGCVFVLGFHQARQTEITHLTNIVLSHQYVARSKIFMRIGVQMRENKSI